VWPLADGSDAPDSEELGGTDPSVAGDTAEEAPVFWVGAIWCSGTSIGCGRSAEAAAAFEHVRGSGTLPWLAAAARPPSASVVPPGAEAAAAFERVGGFRLERRVEAVCSPVVMPGTRRALDLQQAKERPVRLRLSGERRARFGADCGAERYAAEAP
jgi:hypothetical protein